MDKIPNDKKKSPKDNVPEAPPKHKKNDPQAGLQPIHNNASKKHEPNRHLRKD